MATTGVTNRAGAFDLGAFRVDSARRTVVGPSGETMLEPKIMSVLLLLAEQPGQVVSRKSFLDNIWSREFGGDESLTRAISRLRKLLEGEESGGVSIETIPRVGYRLVLPDTPATPPAPTRSRRRSVTWAAVFVLVVLAVFSLHPWKDDNMPGQAEAGHEELRLAVLAFEAHDGADRDTAIALGLADEILSELSRNPSIAVIAGNSSFSFDGDAKRDLDALRGILKISHVIDGLVQRSPEGLRLSVHLVDVRTGLVLWSDVITRPDADIYTIPAQVASSVQAVLELSPPRESRRSYAPDPVAYETFLQARALVRETSDYNLGRAIELLEEAVARDPNLVEAWAALAWARLDLGLVTTSGDTGRPDDDPPSPLLLARDDAHAALSLDPGSVDALLALAVIDYSLLEDPLVETESRIWSLLERAPNHPYANLRMGMVMLAAGRMEDALHYIGKARTLDPLSGLINFYYGSALVACRRWDQLHATLVRAGRYEGYQRSYPWIMERLLLGDFDRPRAFFAGIMENNKYVTSGLGLVENIDPGSPRHLLLDDLIQRLISVAEAGDESADPNLAADLLKASEDGQISLVWVFQLMAAAGMNNAATELARNRVALGEVWFRELLVWPSFQAARHDPAVMELFDVTGQLEYWLQTGNWPDFCADPGLPYDCEEAAERYRQNF